MAEEKVRGSKEVDMTQNGSDSEEQEQGAATPEGELEKLRQEIKTLKEEKEYLHGQVLRKQADFENYRKRMQREKASLRDDVLGDFIKKLLPLLDNMERALVSQKNGTDTGIKEGVELIYRQFLNLLKEEGVEEIFCEGEVFDPHQHDAVMHMESEGAAENTVINELQKGYRFKEKILRCSMVAVAK